MTEPPPGQPPYEPPPPGYYPPPPGYGPPPPGYYPPPPGYYLPPPSQPYQLGGAINWGWRKFTQHWKVLVVGMLPMVVLTLVSYIAYFVFYFDLVLNGDGMSDAEARDYIVRVGITVGVLLLLAIPVSVLQANLQRVALAIADGTTPTFAMLYDTRRIGRILVTLLTLNAATFIGILLCVLPGIAFAFFASFTMLFVLDQDMRTIEAIKASFRLVQAHFGLALLSVLVIGVISGLGSYAIVVGLAVSVPVSLLMKVYCYRALIRGTVRP